MNLSNSMRKNVFLWMTGALSLTFLLTVTAVPFFMKDKPSPAKSNKANIDASADALLMEGQGPIIPVYLSRQSRMEQVPLEVYVRGVVAAEMPIDFELEALKAQALAARTYIIRRMLDADKESSSMPVAAKGALVTDTISHQAYLSEEQLRTKWTGDKAAGNLAKLNRAVDETKNRILTYKGEPIDATFFSTSNGFTENSEDYWGKHIPYLRSVASPWDAKLSPRFKETVTIPYKDVQAKLGLSGAAVPASVAVTGSRVMERTDGHRIGKIRIAGKLFTGREVREKLGLNSTHFEWKVKGSDIEITTTGYGHGVGMSQWGANGMAKEGKKAEEIVRYYYQGIQIEAKPETIK